MNEAPFIVGVSGLRGIAGSSLTPEVAMAFGCAFGQWLVTREGADGATVIVGRDGRTGGEIFYHAAIAGLFAAGCDVRPIDVASTPTIGVCARTAGAGLVVTASHNPAAWNGLKCLIRDQLPDQPPTARAPFAGEAQEIVDRFSALREQPLAAGPAEPAPAEEVRPRPRDRAGGAPDPAMAHVALVLEAVRRVCQDDEPFRGRRLCAVLDSVNASGSVTGVPFLSSVGRVVPLFAAGTGEFPHAPEPTQQNLAEAGGLCDVVPAAGADVGFAQDPDADRLAIVDERGRYIGEEYTLALSALSLMDADPARARDSVIVANLSTSRMVDDVAAAYGARVERAAVGEANVVERMLACARAGERVLLGGEGNGGVIWPRIVHVRDSITAMGLVLALMARTGATISELVARIEAMSIGGRGYAMDKRKIPIASREAADPTIDAVAQRLGDRPGARVDRTDGVRVDLDGSWVHVRPSNTEPIMRLIVEAPSDSAASELAEEVSRLAAGAEV